MDVWCEGSAGEMSMGTALRSLRSDNWISRLLKRSRGLRLERKGRGTSGGADDWQRRIRELHDECDALRRRMRCSA